MSNESQLTCKLSKFLAGVANDPLDDIEPGVIGENGFDAISPFICNDDSSGLLPVGVLANVPMQLPLIDEFDSDELDSDNEFLKPYIPGIIIDSPIVISRKEIK